MLQVFVYGDSLKAQLVAVVVPDPEVLLPWARERNLPQVRNRRCSSWQLALRVLFDVLGGLLWGVLMVVTPDRLGQRCCCRGHGSAIFHRGGWAATGCHRLLYFDDRGEDAPRATAVVQKEDFSVVLCSMLLGSDVSCSVGNQPLAHHLLGFSCVSCVLCSCVGLAGHARTVPGEGCHSSRHAQHGAGRQGSAATWLRARVSSHPGS